MSETEFAENDAVDGGDEEPTMEEILSSIRRIISDDDEPVTEEVADEFESVEVEEDISDDEDDDEILELTEILAEGDPLDNADDLLSPDEIDDLEFSTSEPEVFAEIAEEDPMASAMQELVEPIVADVLISSEAGSQVSDNFNLFANTLLAQNGAGQTVESMVMALMRPMLKGWLDENLPVMVEKIVREEIERVARGGNNM